MDEHTLGPIVTAAVGALFGWLLLHGFRSGLMEWPYFGITLSGHRKDQPVRFWVVATLLSLIMAMCFVATVLQVFWPNGL